MTSTRITHGRLRQRIDIEVRNSPALAPLRTFNHDMIQTLNSLTPLSQTLCLDVGSSVHGFAVEAALAFHPRRFVGIDLCIERHWGCQHVLVQTDDDDCSGELCQMDAHALTFPDATFDTLLSISTFEHFAKPGKALMEMHRVLRPGGVALVSFEPVWTASYGHHLHGSSCAALIPPWAHLTHTPQQMTLLLKQQIWPADCSLSLHQAVSSIYEDPSINRVPLAGFRTLFAESPFLVVWSCSLPDVDIEAKRPMACHISSLLGLPVEDLLTRGLSICLRKG